MGGIVALLEAEGLAVERAVEIGQLSSSPRDLLFVLVPATRGGAGEVVAEEIEPAGSEETAGEEVEQLVRTTSSLMPSTRGCPVASAAA